MAFNARNEGIILAKMIKSMLKLLLDQDSNKSIIPVQRKKVMDAMRESATKLAKNLTADDKKQLSKIKRDTKDLVGALVDGLGPIFALHRTGTTKEELYKESYDHLREFWGETTRIRNLASVKEMTNPILKSIG